MFKNTASQKWVVFAFGDVNNANAGEPITGDSVNITATISIDGGLATALTDVNPTEIGGGYYVFDLTQAETNGNLLLLSPVSATANVNVIGAPGVYNTTEVPSLLATKASQASVDAIAGNVTSILEDTDLTIPTAIATKASQASVDAIASNVTSILEDTGVTIPATITAIQNNVTSILEDTDLTIPTAIAAKASQASVDAIAGNVTSILEDTDLTIPTAIAAKASQASVDAIAGNVTSILEDTDLTIPTAIAAKASQASVDAIAGNVTSILEDTGVTIPASLTAMQDNITSILEDTNLTIPTAIADKASQASVDTVQNNILSILEDTGITIPTAILTRASPAQVRAEIDASIVAYGPATEANLSLLDTKIDQLPAETLGRILQEQLSPANSAPTLEQAIMFIHQLLSDFQISGTTYSVKNINGTEGATMTLDNPTNPSSMTRST